MSAYRDVAGWCEHRPGRRDSTSEACWPGSIALYPDTHVELAAALACAAIAAALASPLPHGDALLGD